MDKVPDGFFSLNNPTFLSIMGRFGIDLIFLFLLIVVVYYRHSQKEKFVFTLFLMGIMAFFICSMLGTVFLDMTFAFGLFAVFGILRLRTRNFSVKDMAYTFTTIGLSVINSLKLLKFPLLGVLIINGIVILVAYLLEEFITKNKISSHLIVYDNLELVKPDKKHRLLKDISTRTGKEILRVKIRKINFKRKIAILDIYYKE